MNITHSPDPYHYYDFHKCMPTPTPNLNSNLRLILNLTSNTVWTLKHLLSKRALCKRPQKDNCPHSNVFYLNICPHKCSYTNIANTHTPPPVDNVCFNQTHRHMCFKAWSAPVKASQSYTPSYALCWRTVDRPLSSNMLYVCLWATGPMMERALP